MRTSRNRRLSIRKRRFYIRLFSILLFITLVASLCYYKFSTDYILTVCIDPGHGGYDTGAISKALNVNEKDLVLDVSLKLGELLEDENIEVIYTRDTDDVPWKTQTKSLQKRCEISNTSRADIFISIHANAYPYKKVVRGTEIWCRFENTKAEKLAKIISTKLSDIGFTENRGLRYEKDKGLYVLRHTNATSVLVELGYISDPTDTKFLISEEGKAQCAKAIAEAIMNYYNTELSIENINDSNLSTE